MYRVTFVDIKTHTKLVKYGFSRYMMKRVDYFLNAKDPNFHPMYEILDVTKLVFNFDTFMKCLTHYSEIEWK